MPGILSYLDAAWIRVGRSIIAVVLDSVMVGLLAVLAGLSPRPRWACPSTFKAAMDQRASGDYSTVFGAFEKE